MDEKMIIRAAGKYRQWMVTEAKKLPSYSDVMNRIDRITEKSREIKKWMTKFLKGMSPRFQSSSYSPGYGSEGIVTPSVYKGIATDMIPDIKEDIVYDLTCVIHMIKAMAEPGKNALTPLSLKDACDEIRIITNAWPDTEYKGGELSVLIKRVVLEDNNKEVELGDFRIKLCLNSPFQGLMIEPQSQVRSDGGFCHPHVSGNRLCTGDGGMLMKDALCKGRLEDYFLIVEAVLRTYNSESPHEYLIEWYDPQHEGKFWCESCDSWRTDDSSCYCEGCECQYCDYCDTGAGGGCCNDCGEWRCGECIECCSNCDSHSLFCNRCTKKCEGCSTSLCESCLDLCGVCCESFCSECFSMSCAYCGDKACEECISTCGCCGENNCSECVDEKCNECEDDICKSCQTNCDVCNKVICETCDDNKCEDCGCPMCLSCEKEHTCLLEEVNDAK